MALTALKSWNDLPRADTMMGLRNRRDSLATAMIINAAAGISDRNVF